MYSVTFVWIAGENMMVGWGPQNKLCLGPHKQDRLWQQELEEVVWERGVSFPTVFFPTEAADPDPDKSTKMNFSYFQKCRCTTWALLLFFFSFFCIRRWLWLLEDKCVGRAWCSLTLPTGTLLLWVTGREEGTLWPGRGTFHTTSSHIHFTQRLIHHRTGSSKNNKDVDNHFSSAVHCHSTAKTHWFIGWKTEFIQTFKSLSNMRVKWIFSSFWKVQCRPFMFRNYI